MGITCKRESRGDLHYKHHLPFQNTVIFVSCLSIRPEKVLEPKKEPAVLSAAGSRQLHVPSLKGAMMSRVHSLDPNREEFSIGGLIKDDCIECREESFHSWVC